VVGPKEDEMGVEIRMELGVGVVLLTEQLADPSAPAVEIDEDQLILGLRLGDGLVERSFEPGLGRGYGCEDEHHGKAESFFHSVSPLGQARVNLFTLYYIIRRIVGKGYSLDSISILSNRWNVQTRPQ
jgi:hypothetical protein